MQRISENSERRIEVLRHMRYEIVRGFDEYTKVPTIGHTRLYWCPYFFGHKDRNKAIALPIDGNEEFVARLHEISQSWLKKTIVSE